MKALVRTLVLAISFASIQGFGVQRTLSRSCSSPSVSRQTYYPVAHSSNPFINGVSSYRTTTSLNASNVDGSDRGAVILGFVLLVAIWIFSIPPEFRRAHICTTDFCVENRSTCYDCVTISEWTQSVKEYYDNGGGISFDFSVAEETKELWAGKK